LARRCVAGLLINCPVARKEPGGWEAVEAENKAVSSLADIEDSFAEDAVFGWPGGSVSAPVEVEVRLVDIERINDEGGAGKVAGRADDLSGVQSMLMHDLGGVIDVLDGVLGLNIFEDCRRGNALASGQLGHDIGLDVLIVGGGSGHDDIRGDSGFILADAFEDTFSLLGRRSAVSIGGIAEDDDGVKVSGSGVVRRDGEIDSCREEGYREDDRQDIEEG
jgi:hypothetical protein